ncbi:Zeta toxin [Streptomyces zhaozhouensis]|uniref:UDP-N-acetylglucosamine kinase n=2 Tax=Streptomyces zhaozhouensis TaxID=1300267 RepID=A0A286E973_9ACTN|nr:Zeta toxin [Streptomyces zhaozhouensis]
MAQHGAGKTTTASGVADVLNKRGGFVDNDSDVYKPYHPQYASLLEEDDQRMALYTGPDGQRWTRQTHDYVLREKVNTLLQETAQSPEFLQGVFSRYGEAGFRREVIGLGVPLPLSQQGVFNRYFEQVQERGSGRLPVPEKMERSFQGILVVAEKIDELKLAEQTVVQRRGPSAPTYANTRGADGEWKEAPNFRGAIERERNRPLSNTEEADFLRTQSKLRQGMGTQWNTALSRIEDLALPILSHKGQQAVEKMRSDQQRAAAAHIRSTTTGEPAPQKSIAPQAGNPTTGPFRPRPNEGPSRGR